jgi:hypothetical protein
LGTEAPEEKFKRISGIVRNIMLNGYPNPRRVGCPGPNGVENLAKFTGDFDELAKQDNYEHVMHCSPCYGEYLEAKRELRAMEAEKGRPLPKAVQNEIRRRLGKLEQIIKSAGKEGRRG